MIELHPLANPQSSPYSTILVNSPYIVALKVDSLSQVLSWTEVRDLHEKARELCPQRFSYWCGLPPELWLMPRLPYLAPPVSLDNCEALRVDIRDGTQFGGDSVVYLTKEQLITLRKILWRVRSDVAMYAASQSVPTVYRESQIQ